MIVDGSTSLTLKRGGLTTIDSMEAEAVKARLAAIKEKYGRDIRVFETSSSSPSQTQESNNEETDDFYEFAAEDYYRIMATKKEDKYLKTKKIREAEEGVSRSRISKAAIRVRFPDNHTLEVTFHPSEKIQSIFDLLKKVVAQPDLPFLLYTTPPPKKLVKELSQDFYSAGFVPGAIVYFAYDLSKENDTAAVTSGLFLQEEIMSLKDLDIISEAAEAVQSAPEPVAAAAAPSPVPQEAKPAGKKPVKPKWLKM